MNKQEAKQALDKIIAKSRVHLYKPIQIAEILYMHRTRGDFDFLNLESYRSISKRWRDDVCQELLGRICTSSSKFQDNLFDENAIPPRILKVLGDENEKNSGCVEAYIYNCFANKHLLMKKIKDYFLFTSSEDFDVKHIINLFWNEPGLKRSLDKIYEIIVYSLFITIIDAMELKVSISVNKDKYEILSEFQDLTKSLMQLDLSNFVYEQDAKVYRVGVTNAADRGLDMYSNWGPAIQIKHLTLDEDLAEGIVDSISSDKIIIVCKDVNKKLLTSIINQIGWRSRIQSIITEENLFDWYEKALRGQHADILATPLLNTLAEEMENEFPSVSTVTNTITDRHYENLHDSFWVNQN